MTSHKLLYKHACSHQDDLGDLLNVSSKYDHQASLSVCVILWFLIWFMVMHAGCIDLSLREMDITELLDYKKAGIRSMLTCV